MGGFNSFAAPESGDKRRVRPESFADHYSQAGQFFRSQQPVEQQHIIDAFVFELSKVERPDIRAAWSPTSATSTINWRRRSAPGSAWRSCRRPLPRRPALSRTSRRRRR